MRQLRIFDIQDGEKFQEMLPTIGLIVVGSIVLSMLLSFIAGIGLKRREK